MPWRALGSLLVAMSVLSVSAHAQIVRGQVVDSLAGTPVGQGFVVLLDGSGTEVARTLTNASGEFSLLAPRVGRYTLRSEVIAYRAFESRRFDLSIRTPTQLTLRILRVPVRLSAFEVVGRERCVPPDESLEIAPVWEEARKALSAAAWTANRTESDYLLHRYQRVESRHERLRQERIWLLEGKATQPTRSVDPDQLVSRGYIVQSGDRRRYHGPDANVLLHDGFQNTHCFWAERGDDQFEGLLGLSFTPVRGRGVSDIEGTLWIEPETAELRQIEYRYTDVPFDFENDAIGGSIHFARLESGAWILSKWEVRAPVIEYERRMTSSSTVGTRQSLAGLQRIGGAVIEAIASDGSVEYASPDIVEISGMAYDSSRSALLVNHSVSVAGTGYAATTDAAGRFRFKTLLEGDYEITLARLDSLGFDYGRARHEFVPGVGAEVVVVVPPLETVYRYHCGAGGLSVANYIIFGDVKDTETSRPLDRVTVELTWIDAFKAGFIPGAVPSRSEILSDDGREHDEQKKVRTEEDGRYVLCPVPGQRPVIVVTDVGNFTGPTYVLRLEDAQASVDDGTGPRSVPVPERILRLDLNLVPERR